MCGADSGTARAFDNLLGSPPRVRSRPDTAVGYAITGGITSACAEQTGLTRPRTSCAGDHLRVCGADPVYWNHDVNDPGSPLRVRSRHGVDHADLDAEGITSACAEQTGRVFGHRLPDGDHLRVCGADSLVSPPAPWIRGSPPRVRSRLRQCGVGRPVLGITSACAEQTQTLETPITVKWDHLRVCGADDSMDATSMFQTGSPPRVRSRPIAWRHDPDWRGITSACAEQTHKSSAPSSPNRDHLRVCGADNRLRSLNRKLLGSPPRVRSRQRVIQEGTNAVGITSACAEQTGCRCVALTCPRDHLRVCGADMLSGSNL